MSLSEMVGRRLPVAVGGNPRSLVFLFYKEGKMEEKAKIILTEKGQKIAEEFFGWIKYMPKKMLQTLIKKRFTRTEREILILLFKVVYEQKSKGFYTDLSDLTCLATKKTILKTLKNLQNRNIIKVIKDKNIYKVALQKNYKLWK